jgi:hypothetical protein
MLLPIQVQVLAVWVATKDRVSEAIARARDDETGELTGNVIFLAALAVAAAAIAVIVYQRLQSNANKIPN